MNIITVFNSITIIVVITTIIKNIDIENLGGIREFILILRILTFQIPFVKFHLCAIGISLYFPK